MRFLSFGASGLVLGILVLGACSSSDTGATTATSADGGTTPSSSGGSTTDTGSAAIVTKTTESMTVNGTARVYVLKVPTKLDPAKTYPLAMDLHGSPGDAAGQSNDGFETTTGQDAIIVYPQAITEDSGAWSWDLANLAAKNPDVAMLEALPAELKTTKGLKIDTTKVFGFGYSGGGFFLQVYQCLGAKAFRAIAASAGGSPDSLRSTLGPQDPDACVACPGAPVPELIVFGKLDDTHGGDSQALCQAQLSGCAATLTNTTPTPCQKYDGCPADKPVEYCNVPDLGHGNWSEAIPTSWAFFKTYL